MDDEVWAELIAARLQVADGDVVEVEARFAP